MSIIEPPPTAPKKETIAIRLEVRVVEELRRYAAFLGTKNFSHIIARSLERVFKADAAYKAWLKVHPDFRSVTKTARQSGTLPAQSALHSTPVSSGVPVSSERQVSSRNSIGGA